MVGGLGFGGLFFAGDVRLCFTGVWSRPVAGRFRILGSLVLVLYGPGGGCWVRGLGVQEIGGVWGFGGKGFTGGLPDPILTGSFLYGAPPLSPKP